MEIHPGHAFLREICVDDIQRRELVRIFCNLDCYGFLTPEMVAATINEKQHFLATPESCQLVVDFIKSI